MIIYPDPFRNLIFLLSSICVPSITYFLSSDIKVLIIFFIAFLYIWLFSVKNISITDSEIIFRHYIYTRAIRIEEIAYAKRLGFNDKMMIRIVTKKGVAIDFINMRIFTKKMIDDLVNLINERVKRINSG